MKPGFRNAGALVAGHLSVSSVRLFYAGSLGSVFCAGARDAALPFTTPSLELMAPSLATRFITAYRTPLESLLELSRSAEPL
jgi:hypothetical protein